MNKKYMACTAFLVLTSLAYGKKDPDIIKLSRQDAVILGNRVWHNECHGSQEKLTFWKNGEEFASMGLPHTTWFPQDYNGPFVQQFPALLKYLKDHGVKLPAWLAACNVPCPWNTQEEFYKDFNSPRMKEIRSLLVRTTSLQARFIVEHFQQSLHNIFTALHDNPTLSQHLRHQLKRLEATPQGIYALIDYANFKGMGINHQEEYNHQGWGLVQVLTKMRGKHTGPEAIQEFAAIAKQLLLERVKNAPPERHEEQWLKGWFNRIDTYA